tara:strand:- start:42 stop:677 length:636 start_codon:yes stop_codon:yes gene_type:complete
MAIKYNSKPIYWNKAKKFLIKTDPVIKQVIINTSAKYYLTRNCSSFETLINAIVGQQISVAAAASISKKIRYNIKRISPHNIYKTKNNILKKCGLSRQKISYIKELSDIFVHQPSYFYQLPKLNDQQVINRLSNLKGIGEWTAQMYLIFQLNRSNIIPLGDLGFINSMIKLYKIKKPITKNILKIANRWSPYKTVAVWHIWRIIDADVVQY